MAGPRRDGGGVRWRLDSSHSVGWPDGIRYMASCGLASARPCHFNAHIDAHRHMTSFNYENLSCKY